MCIRFPDKEAGQVPMAYVVKKPGTAITESQVMDFIAKQVKQTIHYTYMIYLCFLKYIVTSYTTMNLYIGGSIQENSKTGVRGFCSKESLRQDT